MKKLTTLMCASLLLLSAQSVSAQDTTSQSVVDPINIKVFPEMDETESKTITITAVGDIMLGSIVPDKSYCPPNMDASHLLDEVRPYFDSSDVVFCNVKSVMIFTLGCTCSEDVGKSVEVVNFCTPDVFDSLPC